MKPLSRLLMVPILLAMVVGAMPLRTVALAPSPLQSELGTLLRRELPAEALVESNADLLVSLTRVGDGLELTIFDAQGPLLSRRLTLTEGERPALRVATMLIMEAHNRSALAAEAAVTSTSALGTTTATAAPIAVGDPEASEPEASEPEASEPEPDPRGGTSTAVPNAGIRLSAGATAGWWSRPGTPTLGLYAAVRYDFGRWGAGVRAGLHGLCCALALADANSGAGTRIQADLLQLWVVAEGRFALWSGPILGLAATAGAGVELDQVTARATAFVGEPIPETSTALGLLGRLGLAAELRLNTLFSLELQAGLLVRSPRFVARLPPPFTAQSADLDAGPVGPWVELGIRTSPF